MMVRTAKNIFNESISSRILEMSRTKKSKRDRKAKWDANHNYLSEGMYTEEKPECWIVEFLNLLLGKSEETNEFWKEYLLPRAS